MANVGTRDHFRPTQNPAQAIYDAFEKESRLRDSREFEQWVEAERDAVWEAAKTMAKAHNLIVPTREDVIRCEISACGHSDYGAKWAYGLVDVMHGQA